MYTKWTEHLSDPKDKEKFEKDVTGSKFVLRRLKAVLDELETDLNASEVTTKSYDTPSWAFKQADNNGYRRCLNYLKKLIDLDQQENNKDR